jgi:hypothetical protein
VRRTHSYHHRLSQHRLRPSIIHGLLPPATHLPPLTPEIAETETENVQDAKFKSLMTLTVSGDLVSVVENASAAKQAFRGLQAFCVKKEQVRRSVLSSNVEKLAQGQSESVETFITRARLLITEAQDLKAVASAEQLCLMIVRGLLPC